MPGPGMDPERLTEQPHCLCVVSGTKAGLWDGWLLYKPNPPWSQHLPEPGAPVSGRQHSPQLFSVV